MKIDSFVLIGGRSSRLGEDKASLRFNGETLAERAVKTIEAAIPNERARLVAANDGRLAPVLMTGLPFIFDLYLGRGPLGGLHSALASAETKWAFVLACDYPFVSAELIEFIKQQISDEYETIIPVQQDGRLQPLCGFYRVQPWLGRLQEILERPRVSPPLYQLCEDANSRRLTYAEYSWIPNSENLFLNINTKEDLDKAVELEHKLLSGKVI